MSIYRQRFADGGHDDTQRKPGRGAHLQEAARHHLPGKQWAMFSVINGC